MGVARLSDSYMDYVMDSLDRICRLLDQASSQTWQQLAVGGSLLCCDDADLFTRGVVLAIEHDRAPLLTFAWQRVQTRVPRVVPAPNRPGQELLAGGPASDGSGVADVRSCVAPGAGGTGPSVAAAMAQTALLAAIMALVLADLIDASTFERLTRPAAVVIGPSLL